jgi:hypothetical protein
MEEGFLNGAIAAYLDRTKSDNVPDHLMEKFRGEARAAHEAPFTSRGQGFIRRAGARKSSSGGEIVCIP